MSDIPCNETVLIKDLTECLLSNNSDMSNIYRKLSETTSCFATIQTDLLDLDTVLSLEYISRTVIKVFPTNEIETNSPKQASCELIIRKAGGKLSVETFTFDIDTDGQASAFKLVVDPSASVKNKPVQTKSSKSLPTSTFNLEMTKEQRAAKDALILPYMRKLNLEEEVTHQCSSDSDDFDDEDPDDDLEI